MKRQSVTLVHVEFAGHCFELFALPSKGCLVHCKLLGHLREEGYRFRRAECRELSERSYGCRRVERKRWTYREAREGMKSVLKDI